jgi:hypothetical protein
MSVGVSFSRVQLANPIQHSVLRVEKNSPITIEPGRAPAPPASRVDRGPAALQALLQDAEQPFSTSKYLFDSYGDG